MSDGRNGLDPAPGIAAAGLEVDDAPLPLDSPLRYTDRQLGMLLTQALATQRHARGSLPGLVCEALGYPFSPVQGRTDFPNQDFSLVLHRTGSGYLASLPTHRVARLVVVHIDDLGTFVGLQVMPIGRPAVV